MCVCVDMCIYIYTYILICIYIYIYIYLYTNYNIFKLVKIAESLLHVCGVRAVRYAPIVSYIGYYYY